MSTIRKKRIEKCMSQAELAKAMGVAQNTISCWEIGKRHPSIPKLVRLAEILECSVSELVDD